jgi:hypothetical protein
MAEVTENHLKVKLHALQILSGQEGASLLLTKLGDAIKKQMGHTVKGKLKKILALFPADFWIDAEDKVVMLNNQTSPGRPIVPPEQEVLCATPSRCPSNFLPTVTLQKQDGKASQAGAVLPAWVGIKLNRVASQSGASNSSASASTSQKMARQTKGADSGDCKQSANSDDCKSNLRDQETGKASCDYKTSTSSIDWTSSTSSSKPDSSTSFINQ